jgi:hypothetical protein
MAVSILGGAVGSAVGAIIEGEWDRIAVKASAGALGSISAAVCFDIASRNYRWALAGLLGWLSGASGSFTDALLMGAFGGIVMGILIRAFVKEPPEELQIDHQADGNDFLRWPASDTSENGAGQYPRQESNL